MINIIICKTCGSTISNKYFKFKEMIKNKNIEKDKDNSDIFKKLNITRMCCKIILISSLPDMNYMENNEI